VGTSSATDEKRETLREWVRAQMRAGEMADEPETLERKRRPAQQGPADPCAELFDKQVSSDRVFTGVRVEKFFRKIGQNGGFGGCTQEVRQIDARGGSDGAFRGSDDYTQHPRRSQSSGRQNGDSGDKAEVISDQVAVVGDKVHYIDEKFQVVIDGARGLSTQSLSPSNI
jgi:hypothetical protein